MSRRAANDGVPQVIIGRPCHQPNAGASQRCDILQIVFEFVIGKFAGRDLPCGADYQQKDEQSGNDLNNSHDEPNGQNAECCKLEAFLHAAVTAGRIEMHRERISRQSYRNTVIGSNVDRRRARRTDPLNGDLLWCQRDLMISGLFHDRVDNLLVRLVGIRPAHHRDLTQVVLERVIAQLRRNDLKTAIDQCDEYQNPDDRLNCAHGPRFAPRDAELTYNARPSTP